MQGRGALHPFKEGAREALGQKKRRFLGKRDSVEISGTFYLKGCSSGEESIFFGSAVDEKMDAGRSASERMGAQLFLLPRRGTASRRSVTKKGS